MTISLREAMEEALELRANGNPEEALSKLLALHEAQPDDPLLNLQVAWTHDILGLEAEAVPFYEAALAGELTEDQTIDATVGLGSTLRALGRYQDSVSTLRRGVQMFPSERRLRVFYAMALYNVGQAKAACEMLLQLLIETTSDEQIKAYRPALAEYAADLDRSW